MDVFADLPFHIEGRDPGLMTCNVRLASKDDPFAQEIRRLQGLGREQTADHRREIAELQWRGGLYLDEDGPDGKVIIPGANIEKMIQQGCYRVSKGMLESVKAGVFCQHDPYLLVDDKPKTANQLRGDPRFSYTTIGHLKKQQSRVTVTRPVFPKWTLKFTLTYNTDFITAEDLIRFVYKAGERVGLGTWKPRYGRFKVLSPAHPEDEDRIEPKKSKKKATVKA